ncbi:anaphase-promoting complex subunit 15 [Anopheles merus]|uniref:anaphase-promoting complex subunit 15 n=1 Tax=Anopheles merus TaxID=30066 RepID=UPI001BE3D46C|nr:anaphase-promoting complex subunit 15 [Anopheles merus]XP_041768634.1 anaphase-promoting complex subunit 15 [Anopheles merus]
MIPFYPSLQPSAAYNFWFSVDESYDDDAEVNNLETEHTEWLNRITLIGQELTPIGKSSNEQHMENMDTEDEDANDESDDSDNSDDDDDDMDDMNNTRNLPDEITVVTGGYMGDDTHAETL